jgi:hypothetical protein
MNDDLKLYMPIALKNHEVRLACHAVERITGVGDVLDNLSPAALEMIRDHCLDCVKGRHGAMSEFKRAYINLVVEHLNDARLHERRLYYGLTGEASDACDDGTKETA